MSDTFISGLLCLFGFFIAFLIAAPYKEVRIIIARRKKSKLFQQRLIEESLKYVPLSADHVEICSVGNEILDHHARINNSICSCSLRTQLVGDGCSICNPEFEAEYTGSLIAKDCPHCGYGFLLENSFGDMWCTECGWDVYYEV